MTDVPAPGRQARALLRAADRAVLSTALAADGWPYGSLVLLALDHAARPLLLLSTLAEHTRNLQRDPRVSLLVDGTGGHAQPLTGPRVTVLGTIARSDDPADRARFLGRHPDAGLYQGFGDFAVYRLAPTRAHLVAGFGAIHWIEAGDLLLDTAPCRALQQAEADIVAHMNEDHADAIDACAAGLLGQGGTGWRMTGIDPEGADLRRGGAVARLAFDHPVDGPAAAREALVALVRLARSRGAGGQAS